MKRIVLLMLAGLFVLTIAVEPALAGTVTVYFFWGEGCPHCMQEKEFLLQLLRKYPEIEIKSFEVWYNRENARLLTEMSQWYGKKVEGVPTTFIGNFEPIIGYLDQETTGKDIEAKVRYCIKYQCVDPLITLQSAGKNSEAPPPSGAEPLTKEPPKSINKPGETMKLRIPLVGEVDPSTLSLPLFTLILAGLDGFNPCAFFVLFLLLSILVYAHSRKIMLMIGITFVFFSGLIYFLFMAAWLNAFLLFGQLKVVTTAAGILAVVIALINIKDFFFFNKGVSLKISEKAKPKLYEHTRNILKKGSIPSMIVGSVVLAIAANTYELLCTAGFPMVYTRALTLHNLTTLQYYLYLAFYNLIYVIPLAVIVLLFTITLGARKLTEWQGQVLKLISGLMMLFLGLALLTKPDLLNNVVLSGGMLALSLIAAGVIIAITKRLGQGRGR